MKRSPPLLLRWAFAALLGLVTISALAVEATSTLPPPYAPQRQVSGTIRIWGHGAYAHAQDFIEELVRAWEDGFRRRQPSVQFDNKLYGTASAIGALYTYQGDLALMGREIWPMEVAAFQEVKGYEPAGVDVVTGSFDVRNRGYAIVVFVHKGNPLRQLTLAQLDAIYSVDRRRGGKPARTWGDLGLGGDWRDKPIHVMGLPIARGFAEYFEQRVFLGARKWNPAIQEFADNPGSKGGDTDGGQKMLDALARDPLAIGYAGLVYHNDNVKPLALAETDAGPFVPPTQASVADHSYPLTRVITMFFDQVPGKPLDPRLAEFLRYILSGDGQREVIEHGHGYLPIPATLAKNELAKLEGRK